VYKHEQHDHHHPHHHQHDAVLLVLDIAGPKWRIRTCGFKGPHFSTELDNGIHAIVMLIAMLILAATSDVQGFLSIGPKQRTQLYDMGFVQPLVTIAQKYGEMFMRTYLEVHESAFCAVAVVLSPLIRR
jgi:hypothetical protein